jgi:hypothetical protein
MRRLTTFLVLVLFIVLPIVSAVSIGESDSDGVVITPPEVPTNFSIQNVNSSDFWDNLDTPLDITALANYTSDTVEIKNRLGIGTGSPSASLHISPPVATVGLMIDNTASREITFNGAGTANIYNDGGGIFISANNNDVNLGGTVDAQHLVVKNDGNIGFGTTTPKTIASFTGTTERFYNFVGTPRTYLAVQGNPAEFSLVDTGGALNDKWFRIYLDNGKLRFRSLTDAGSARQSALFNIDMGDNLIGIGTETPAYNLHVKDATENVEMGLETDKVNGQAQFRLINDAQEYRIGVSTTDEFFIYDATGVIRRFTIEPTSGNVGIGTASPVTTLHTYEDNADAGTSNGLTLEQDGEGDIGINFLLTGIERWMIGIDNDDGDKFKITEGVGLGSNDIISIDPVTHQTDIFFDLNVTGNITTEGFILENGGRLWDNETCTFLASPDGSTITEVCNA